MQYPMIRCAGCGKDMGEDEIVWVDPTTGEATWENGLPYHVECAPPQHPEDNDGQILRPNG